MTSVYLFVYRRIDTPNGPEYVGQWDTFQFDSNLVALVLKREFAYSPGYRA